MGCEIERAIAILETGSEMPNIPHTFDDVDKACKLAVQALKEKLDREKPKALSIEQLRGMDGEPVWVDNGFTSMICGLVTLLWTDTTAPKELQIEQEVIVFRYGDFLPLEDVNVRYKAYTQKPEQEGEI